MDNQRLLDAIIASFDDTSCVEQITDAVPVLEAFREENLTVERAYNRYIRELSKDKVALCGDDTDTAYRILASIEQMVTIDAAVDFDSYMLKMEWRRDPDRRFYQPRRKVLFPITQQLQLLYEGFLDFLSVSLPPRVGKSTMCIFFLTFIMGNNPERANVMTGHSDTLTDSFFIEALSIITDANTYCFHEIFPNAKFKKRDAAHEQIHLKSIRRFPTLTCRSIDGTLTGAVEVGKEALLYCDDLVRNREEALNADRMNKLYQSYLNQLKERKLDGAKELHVGTRWAPNDVIGRIEEQYSSNPRYRFYSLPALNDKDESNFDYQYDLGFSTEYYRDMRRSLIDAGEEDSWSAKFMCTPYWREGVLYEREDLNFYETLPLDDDGNVKTPDNIVAVCDTKTKGGDYCVMVVGYVYGNNHYIHDVICSDSLMENIQPRLVDSLCFNNVHMCRFESNVAGGKIALEVQEACRLRNSAVEIRMKYSTENKQTRIEADAGWVKQRCLFKVTGDADYRKFLSLLTSYTAKGKNKHDDVPDTMSLYRRFIDTTAMATVSAMKRPF